MRRLIFLGLTLMSMLAVGQDYELKTTMQVYSDIQKLHRGLRVLYLAAHPDDENTRMISWLESNQHIETAYLSLTRGQGGQNLIGDEKGDALGVIRTYELLGARSIDGGEQFFTRAVDFGYSKSAKESFEKWGKEEVLSDVVYVIRKFRPHVIITRFPANNYAGHGHHEASAILAEEAFDLANDPNAFPEQLKTLQPWQPEVLYHNTSSWWRKELDEKSAEDLTAEKIHRINIGVFDPLTGLAINERASLARSMHRCQAFGTWRDRGKQFEYLQLVKGEWRADLFDSMQGIWKQSSAHKEALAQVLSQYDFTDPERNLRTFNDIMGPRFAQRNLWADPQDVKLVTESADRIRLAMMGIRVEVFAGQDPVVIGDEYPVKIQVYNAGKETRQITFNHNRIDTSLEITAGKQVEWEVAFTAPMEPSTPYWLRQKHDNLYVHDMALLGEPIMRDEMIEYTVKDGFAVKGKTELHRKWRDSSIGEVLQPMLFVPIASITPDRTKLPMRVGSVYALKLKLKAYQDVELHASATPNESSMPVVLKKGQVETIGGNNIELGGNKNYVIPFDMYTQGQAQNLSEIEIRYSHIPEITMFQPSEVELLPIQMEPVSGTILYIEGSGDEVDESLEFIGYKVDRTRLSDISEEQLKTYKAVIVGIRAFNTNQDVITYRDKLMNYVKEGGNMIVQYNTSRGLLTEDIGPFPFKLDRGRVTEESANVTILAPKHPVFNKPNKINLEDWSGWVQERGLYFADSWDEHYTPLLAWHDEGEEPLKGALIVAGYWKGTFTYTGISFFRQLPAGVPGAYRLMVNLIELK